MDEGGQRGTEHTSQLALTGAAVHRIEREQLVPVSVAESFAFFADAFNLETITPPWLRFRILTPPPIPMREGTSIEYRLVLHRLPFRWRTRIESWEPGRRFVDTQVRGPFRLWEHTHTFEERPGGTLIRDRVAYRMPFGLLGALAHELLLARDLERIFDYRRDAVARLFGGAPTEAERGSITSGSGRKSARRADSSRRG